MAKAATKRRLDRAPMGPEERERFREDFEKRYCDAGLDSIARRASEALVATDELDGAAARTARRLAKQLRAHRAERERLLAEQSLPGTPETYRERASRFRKSREAQGVLVRSLGDRLEERLAALEAAEEVALREFDVLSAPEPPIAEVSRREPRPAYEYAVAATAGALRPLVRRDELWPLVVDVLRYAGHDLRSQSNPELSARQVEHNYRNRCRRG